MTEKHSLALVPLTASKFLERFSFYGMRSILLLYVINGPMAWTHEDAMSMYKFFVYGGLLMVLGGLFGDLAIGSRRTAIIGGFMQAAGYFVLAIPNAAALYLAIFLILTGAALYVPNLLVMINLAYRNRRTQMDAAMTIVYVAVNIAAFLAMTICGFLHDIIGWAPVFLICGFLMTGSQLILLLAAPALRDVPFQPNVRLPEDIELKTDLKRVTGFILVIVLIPFYWVIYDLSGTTKYEVLSAVQESVGVTNGFSLSENITVMLTILFGVVLGLIWSFSKMSSYLKLAIGVLVYALSVAVLLMINKETAGAPTILFLLFTFFLDAVSDMFVGPIALSIILRDGPQKYQSLMVSSYLTLTSLFSVTVSFLSVYDSPVSRWITLGGMLILLVIAGLFFWMYARTRKG